MFDLRLLNLAKKHNAFFSITHKLFLIFQDKRSYDKKKTLGQGLLDVALLASNVAILKAVIKAGPSYEYFVPMIVFIALSLFVIIVVAILLLIIGTTEYINNIRKKSLERLVIASIIFILFVLIFNTFIGALGLKADDEDD